MVYIFWTLSLLALYYLLEKRKKDRIDEIIDMINNIKSQNYKISMKQDDFSVLEDYIYKLFLEIFEAEDKTKKTSLKQVEYLEDIAHQIKTPISNMLFSVENIEITYPNLENATLIKNQLLRLNSLSDILLKLSSLDANKDRMKKENINLYEVIEYSLEVIDINNNIKVQINSDLKEIYITGDFYWISEAIINIIKNASNRPLCDKISIYSSQNPLYSSIFIQDNGGGIDKKYINKIFKRFYKTPDSKGFGIGLAMAKTIIEKNNGEILVKNTKDGAIFEIKFYNIT